MLLMVVAYRWEAATSAVMMSRNVLLADQTEEKIWVTLKEFLHCKPSVEEVNQEAASEEAQIRVQLWKTKS